MLSTKITKDKNMNQLFLRLVSISELAVVAAMVALALVLQLHFWDQ